MRITNVGYVALRFPLYVRHNSSCAVVLLEGLGSEGGVSVGSCIGNDQGHNEEVTSKRENMIRKKKCE
jgi:hypothetical protein